MKRQGTIMLIGTILVLASSCGMIRFGSPTQKVFVKASPQDKLCSFKTDVPTLTRKFSEVLQREGYHVTFVDPEGGHLRATKEMKDSLASFNSGFVGGTNYKVSEALMLEATISPQGEGSLAKTDIRKAEKYSMGQRVSQEINDLYYFKDIYRRVERSL